MTWEALPFSDFWEGSGEWNWRKSGVDNWLGESGGLPGGKRLPRREGAGPQGGGLQNANCQLQIAWTRAASNGQEGKATDEHRLTQIGGARRLPFFDFWVGSGESVFL